MKLRLVQLTGVLAVLLAVSGVAYGQGATTSTISGVVLDTAGAVVPGADVTAKHEATGVTQSTVTNSQGAFVFPSLNVGNYTVTVSLTGFKTFVAQDVVLTSGAPANVRAVLELGGITEQIVVSSTSEIVQTQSSTISQTINTNQITKLPLTSRSAMDFVTFLPGVLTPAGNRDSMINGLPQGVINITLDGINVQDNTNRSTDGFFAIVSPRLDAIEEVTVTTAGQGADAGGQGAVQIKFVTRSGTNQFSGSGYHYYRNDKLNANTWFNNRDDVAKPELLQNQGGFRAGGPIVVPGLFNGRGKAFFFVNYEEFRQPSDTTRRRTILNPTAQSGVFSYTSGGVTRSVNVLTLAAQNTQLASLDPTVAAVLRDIRTAATSTGSIQTIDNLNLDRFSYNLSVTSLRRYPTGRVDVNVTDKHRFTSAVNFQYFTDSPDTLNNRDAQFPGFPVEAGQSSKRLGLSNSFRSTLGRNLVNEARVGYSGAPVEFFKEMNTGMYTGSLANTKGFHLVLGNIGQNLTNAGTAIGTSSRDASDLTVENTLTWLNGKHNITSGLSFTQYSVWLKNSNLVPTINFGLLATDPANSLFTAANFPGASNANLTQAGNLYALLTGRVSSIVGDARLDEGTGEYAYMGTGLQRSRMRETGIFLQDSWRLKPTLTVNAGLRYDVQFPFYALNNSYSTPTLADMCGVSGVNNPDDGHRLCNLFQAGVMPGKRPEFVNLQKGDHAYNTDWDNVAPNVGFAWSPSRRNGMLGSIMGDEFVIRAGYARAYSRNGMGDFTGQYNQNPGVTVTATRSDGNGNLVQGGPVPVLFRETARLGPPAFAATPVYPMTDVVTQDINMFDPNIQVPWADSWTAGIQRSLGRNMALEVRYVGTRSRDGWTTLNYNEVNVFDNGFINEFRQAQANLAANVAAGRGNTFAFTGAPGTAPLPTFLAFFNGLPSSQAGNTASYAGTNWSNSTFLSFLAARNPNPHAIVFNTANNNAGTGMLNNATMRANAARAGLPANYFVVNPDLLGGVDFTTNGGKTDYNSLQIELRRRLSHGLQFQTSYVMGKAMTSRFETFRRDRFMIRDTGTPGDVSHGFKANVVYDLPFGQGRRFASNANGFVDRLVGGWQLGVATRVQSGRLVDLGNHRLVGMTLDELQAAYTLRFDHAGKKIYMLPQDIIDNTIRAFSVSATSASGYSGTPPTGRYLAPANGPDCIEVDQGGNNGLDSGDFGECGARALVVTGPTFRQTDIRISKRTSIVGRINFEIAAEMLNAFNQANFIPVGGIGNAIGDYEVTNLTGTNTFRTIQIVSRINW